MRNKRFNLFFTKISIFLQNVKKFPPFYPALPNLIPQGIFGWRFLFLACSIDFILPAGYRDDLGALYNHKTSHDTATKIATNNVFIISNN